MSGQRLESGEGTPRCAEKRQASKMLVLARDLLPFEGQEKAKQLGKETEKEQGGDRKSGCQERRGSQQGASERAKRMSSGAQEGTGDFWKGQLQAGIPQDKGVSGPLAASPFHFVWQKNKEVCGKGL